ncbi:hypothetical protein OROMI_003597 [Orobanche minor]
MKRSSKAESKEAGKYAALIQQFLNLEIEWKILKDSRRGRNKPDASDNISSSILLAYSDRAVMDKSPRGLVSYLQHRKSPSLSRVVRNCDLVVEEILRDRRAAIISGKLKGRRLFQKSEEEDSDLNEEISKSDWLHNMTQERKVMVVNDRNSIHGGKRRRIRSLGGEDDESTSVASDQSLSRSFSDNSVSEEKVVVVAVKEDEKRGGAGGKPRGGDRGYMVSVAWFAFVLILAILGLISMSCHGKFVEVNDEFMILVPT